MARLRRGKQLDGEWLRWLHANIARGCSKAELSAILRSEGFVEPAIEKAFAAAPPRMAATPPVAAPPARPAIPVHAVPRARLKLPGAVRHAPAKIELFTVDDFLGAEECAAIVERISAQLRPSTISTPPEGEYDTAFRTSRTCDLVDGHPVIAALDEKICRAIGFDKWLSETTQGQHYEVGQVFKTHTDFFKPYELDRFSTETLGQRTWTFMIYLNDPEGGGETEFVDLGMKVTPKRGRAVLWNNLLPSGEGNPFTRHQSLPVTAGTKTIITKWFRMPRPRAAVFSSTAVSWTQKL